MGHRSRYTLYWDGCGEQEVRTAMAVLDLGYFADIAIDFDKYPVRDDGGILLSAGWDENDTFKWYQHSHDMHMVSALLPDATLCIVRVAEDWASTAPDCEGVAKYTYRYGVESEVVQGTSVDGVTATFPKS